MVCYTNGSKLEGKEITGAALYAPCPSTERSFHWKEQTTVSNQRSHIRLNTAKWTYGSWWGEDLLDSQLRVEHRFWMSVN